jgi:PmbA protein
MSGVADDLLAILEQLVERAEAGEGLEAFGVDGTTTEVRADKGEVESLSSARSRGVGVRVIRDGRLGYAYTADLDRAALDAVLEEARANAGVTTPEDANRLPDPAAADDVPGLHDPAFAEVSVDDKVDLAVRLDTATRAHEQVTSVDIAVYGDSDRVAAIASSAGLRGAYRRCDAWLLVEAIASSDGTSTSAYAVDAARLPGGLDVEQTAAEAAERASRLLGGRPPSTGRLPVLLDPMATASLLGVLSGPLTAEAVQKGRSLFADKVGESLAGDHVTLVDDGRLPEGLATSPWDGEGVPSGRTVLLEAGVLRRFLHNTYTAAKDGVASTGNASRAGYASPPGVSSSNLFLEPGPHTREELLAQAGVGFYCQQILGVHSGVNPISGDFSVGASGLMVRDGALAEPVREATIAGTIPDILAGLVAVGSDLRFLPLGGGPGGQTGLIVGMMVSGA